jgi:hypothetical protein
MGMSDAKLLNNAKYNDNKCPGGHAYLNPASTKYGDYGTTNYGCYQPFFGRYTRCNGKCNG